MEELGDGDGELGAGDGGNSPIIDPLIQCESRILDDEAELCCCVATGLPHAIKEQPEARAYKLGKHKCSYNRVKLIIRDALSSSAKLKISEAVQIPVGPADVDDRLRESCLKFQVRFTQGNRIDLFILLVYSSPIEDYQEKSTQQQSYKWIPVTRSKCKNSKNPCKGPVLRGLQRFGTQKSPRNLYVAIDEASTHVCPVKGEASTFRFLLAAYDDQRLLLGSTVSSPIRVFCNNDTPLGAASLKIKCDIKGGWQAREKQKRTRTPFADLTNTSEWIKKCSKTTGSCQAKTALPDRVEAPSDDRELRDHVDREPEKSLQRPRFEPFEQLQSLFSPIQIDYLQKQNPDFLYNFVRYSRELYNTYYRDTAKEITRPTAKRPSIPKTEL
ncbi:hypothetical protein SELMODRAFT_439296 [Selaginella moellendorffii]|uniref:Uncharacterized protein n=1 Tax=Selaginella moellendorffii TaxID=88036 RepID=D8R3E5_SELML|nr:uncharacterized protein LOC9635653 [Selaginella moellendorffii]EFJ33264.1 hypothetical protein SELMODRAFT_439296 [Selaginella moellendorffii]|eukprot:XP_002965844.1 uncharacterized protein LOC9635653 [Selaginella moellendorffii]